MTAEKKQQLRQQMQRRRASFSAEKWQKINADILEAVLQDADFKRSHTVFTFYSVENEVSTHALIDVCLRMGKTVCVPKCGAAHQMTAYEIHAHTDLTEQKYGIPEPPVTCRAVAPNEIDVMIVPCLCADKTGQRLGYGGGYYDRYLTQCSAVSLLVCPLDCIVDTVPAEPFDKICDKLITDKGGLL